MSNTPFYAPAMRFGNKFGSVPMIDGLAFDGPVTVRPRSGLFTFGRLHFFFWTCLPLIQGPFERRGAPFFHADVR